MTQPEEMKTTAYVYGVEKLNGYDACRFSRHVPQATCRRPRRMTFVGVSHHPPARGLIERFAALGTSIDEINVDQTNPDKVQR